MEILTYCGQMKFLTGPFLVDYTTKNHGQCICITREYIVYFLITIDSKLSAQ